MEGERKKSMYRKDSEGWLKHTDFIILDMICLQLAYVLAYAISGYGFNPYETIIYRNMAVFLELADLVMIFAYGTMKSVLKRGYYRDFVVTLNHAIMVGALAVLYLFLLHEGQDFSRLTLMLTIIIYLVMTYVVRELWKKLLRKQMKDGGERKLLIVTSEDVAEQVVLSMQENNYARFSLAGVAVIDADWTGREIHGVPVVANEETAAMYVCQEWIDEVLIVVSEVLPYPSELIEQLSETGVTIHLNLAKITSVPGKKQFVEKVGDYTVLTTSINYASTRQLMLKRLMDIAGGLVGCIFTGIICIFIGPAIYIASPGPIFFSQERVGKNGKKFKMYKFRTMTDERDENGELLPDDVRLTKFGAWLRKTSLDELAEAFNILNGKMSVIGPRPQLVRDMTFMTKEQRMRHTAKPGLSGLAQVNGRNAITWEDKLEWDQKYIKKVGFRKDVRIILETVKKAFIKQEGISQDDMATAEDFGDYLLRTGKINLEEYQKKQKKAKEILTKRK